LAAQTLAGTFLNFKNTQIMAYLAVNKDGDEVMFKHKPYFDYDLEAWRDGKTHQFGVFLPKCSIIAMTGQKLTWNDEPIKI
jgi:hypothetical protein